MTVGISATVRNNMLDEITGAQDAGASAGKIYFYDGTKPSTGAAVTTQTLLATCTLSDPSAAAAAAGVLTYSSVTDGTIVADSTVTWFRIVDSDDTHVMDGTVGVTGSGADIEFGSTTWLTDGVASVTSLTLTAGNT